MAKAKSSKNFLVLQNYLVWLFKVGERGRILLLAKAKSSKSFLRFCVSESRVDSTILHFACEILQFIESSVESQILRNCRIAGRFDSLKRGRILLLAKAKSSKRFYAPRARFCELRFACEILRFWIIDSTSQNLESKAISLQFKSAFQAPDS